MKSTELSLWRTVWNWKSLNVLRSTPSHSTVTVFASEVRQTSKVRRLPLQYGATTPSGAPSVGIGALTNPSSVTAPNASQPSSETVKSPTLSPNSANVNGGVCGSLRPAPRVSSVAGAQISVKTAVPGFCRYDTG